MDSIGPYRIVRKLGAGGMGEVYLAQDIRLDRQVALKILTPDLGARDQRLEWFTREARVASSLNHPNIAHIYDVGESAGVHYIAMEYVEGEPLSARLAGAPLALTEILDVAAQVADALHEAHSRGIVHRDIKPANIMITPRQQAKVLDFGVARRVPDPIGMSGNTETCLPSDAGLVLGTIQYMSPEQALGRSADRRSDIFSFGIVLYELSTGRLPFTGSSATEVLDRIVHEAPAAIGRFNYALPQQFEYIVRKCLEKDAGSRYQSAHELAVDLRNLRRDGDAAGRAVPASAPRRRGRRGVDAIAVMPFVNAAMDPALDYLTDGLTESLINSLATLLKPRVMARSTIFRFKGRDLDPMAVGRELDVQAVVTGRLQAKADNLVVTVELVDALNGAQLWGGRYNRKLADIFAVEADIAAEIAGNVRGRLTGAERTRLVKRHTRSTEAYESYLKGLFHANQRTQEGLSRAVEYFNEAIGRDPSFALAHAGLADCYVLIATAGYTGPSDSAALARQAADRAMALDPNLPEALATSGLLRFRVDWDWSGAEQDLQNACRLNPGSATIHHRLALLMTALGRTGEALRSIEQAQQLDPLSLVIGTAAGRILHFTGQYDAAIEQCRRTLQVDPAFVPVHFDLGMAYAEKGLLREAMAEFEQHMEAARERPVMLAVLGHMYARAGRTDDAHRMLNEIQQRRAAGKASAYDVGLVLLGLREVERCLDWFERARDERAGILVFLKVEPMYDPIRRHPRFVALQESMHL